MLQEKTINEELLEQSREALKNAGNRNIEIAGSASEEMRIVYEADDFSVSASGKNLRLGIRTLQDHRLGFVSTNSTSNAAIAEAVEESYSMARLSPPSEHYGFAEPGPNHVAGQEFINEDSQLPHMSEQELVDVADRVIAAARNDPRIRLDRVEVALVRDTRSLLNSHGIELSMRRSYVTWSAMGMARDGEQVTSFDYDGGVAFRIPEIEERIQTSMGRFRESVLGSLNPRPGRSYQGPVLLHPSLVRQFLLGTIAYNANGKNQQDGVSTWNGKQGSPVTSPGINIYEDPLDASRPETFLPFDREGLLTGKHSLVEDGKLSFTGHNIYSARRAGEKPTGNASGGASGTPGVGFTNVKIELDGLETEALESLMKRMNHGLLIKRFSGNADPSSGHFSGVAKNSYWIENGSIAHPVQEIMVAGNLFQLMQQLVAGTDIDYEIMGGSRAPYLIVDGLNVTAG